MRRQKLSGLYVITNRPLASGAGLIHQVAQALAGNARVVQYRDKGSDRERRLHEASSLQQLCHQANVPLLINDDLELAHQIAADGIHLGIDDPDLQSARQRLGPAAIIGVSCYNQFERAREAQRAGADYVAFGRFFPSSIKPHAVQAQIELLQRARAELRIPTVAIGGITPENGGALVEAGADMLAVIQGVFGQPDIRAACERFNQLFQNAEVSHYEQHR